MLDVICQRLTEQHGITLEIDDHVKEFLSEEGYKPEFGARELRRTVERLLEARIAEHLLMHDEKNGKIWKVRLDQQTILIES